MATLRESRDQLLAQVEQNRARRIDAAAELRGLNLELGQLLREGFGVISVVALSKASGLSRQTLYRYLKEGD